MAQLSYSIDTPAVAFPGQLVDIAPGRDIVTAMASVAIPYGCLVVRSSAASFQAVIGKLPVSAAEITAVGSAIGVAVADQARAQDPSVSGPQYAALAAVPCLKKRRIWVVVEDAVLAGGACFVRFLAGTNGSQLGAFRSDVDTISTVDHAAALPGARFVAAAGAGEYAVVELDLA